MVLIHKKNEIIGWHCSFIPTFWRGGLTQHSGEKKRNCTHVGQLGTAFASLKLALPSLRGKLPSSQTALCPAYHILP